VCQCEHGYNVHDRKTGACQQQWDHQRSSRAKGLHWVQMSCACVRYIGPQPPPEHQWVPPVDDLFTKPEA
jgi:hypothetical protein